MPILHLYVTVAVDAKTGEHRPDVGLYVDLSKEASDTRILKMNRKKHAFAVLPLGRFDRATTSIRARDRH